MAPQATMDPHVHLYHLLLEAATIARDADALVGSGWHDAHEPFCDAILRAFQAMEPVADHHPPMAVASTAFHLGSAFQALDPCTAMDILADALAVIGEPQND